MLLNASVSNIELFRTWEADEDLDLEWFLRQLRGEEPQTEKMLAGVALHKCLENPPNVEANEMSADGYTFLIQCDCLIALPTVREIPVEVQYGGLNVRGRVDGFTGNRVIDYKTTGQFDPDRLMSGYQWRFYLDMTGASSFEWLVFVMDEFAPKVYEINQFHRLSQARYPNLKLDCLHMAARYEHFLRGLKPEQYERKQSAVAAAQ